MCQMHVFEAFLNRQRAVILDGGFATQLERNGKDLAQVCGVGGSAAKESILYSVRPIKSCRITYGALASWQMIQLPCSRCTGTISTRVCYEASPWLYPGTVSHQHALQARMWAPPHPTKPPSRASSAPALGARTRRSCCAGACAWLTARALPSGPSTRLAEVSCVSCAAQPWGVKWTLLRGWQPCPGVGDAMPAWQQRRLRPLVAFSAGPYAGVLADGAEYTGSYAERVTEEQLIDFHRQRLQVLLLLVAHVPHAASHPSMTASSCSRLWQRSPALTWWPSRRCPAPRSCAPSAACCARRALACRPGCPAAAARPAPSLMASAWWVSALCGDCIYPTCWCC